MISTDNRKPPCPSRTQHPPRWVRGAVICLLVATSCDEQDIRSYEVPATQAVAAKAEASPISASPPASELAGSEDALSVSADEMTTDGVSWRLPAGWKRVPGERPMRIATLEADKDGRIEISISRFPGDTGGLLANTNRWRQQVGLAPITEADLPQQVTPIKTVSMEGHVMRLKGEQQYLLGAVLTSPDKSETWFVKATASPQIVDRHEADFNTFVGSARIGATPVTQPANN